MGGALGIRYDAYCVRVFILRLPRVFAFPRVLGRLQII